MNRLTAGGTLVSWGPSPVNTTSIQGSTFPKPSSNHAIRILSVSCCTLCPRLDGPSDHVNERAIRSGITVVTLLNYTYKGPCPLPCVYRQRFRLCSSKHLIQPLYMILQGWCCAHDIIDKTHDEVPVFLCYIRECLGHQSLE